MLTECDIRVEVALWLEVVPTQAVYAQFPFPHNLITRPGMVTPAPRGTVKPFRSDEVPEYARSRLPENGALKL